MVKTWFITGISSALGRKMTEQLLARGDRVAGTARKLHALDGLKSRYANQLSVAALDVTDVRLFGGCSTEPSALWGASTSS